MASLGFQVILYPMDEITLKAVHSVKMLLLHPFAAQRTLLPRTLRSLVSTYMDVAGREHSDDLIEDTLQDAEGFFIAGTHVG